MRGHDANQGGSQRVMIDKSNMPQIQVGAPIKANMDGHWIRGRFEMDQEQGMSQPVINAGDKRFRLPEGTEIEIM